MNKSRKNSLVEIFLSEVVGLEYIPAIIIKAKSTLEIFQAWLLQDSSH